MARVFEFRVLLVPTRDRAGVLSMLARGQATYYLFREIPCEIGGRGFALQRLDREAVYHVRIGARDDCSCECLGFLRHGHCKHIRGLLILADSGALG